MQQIHGFSPSSSSHHQTHDFRLRSSNPIVGYSSSSYYDSRRNNYTPQTLSLKPNNLKRLTFRIVQLTRRKQLHQIFEEVELAKIKHGNELNTIVMNAVMEGCVHCKDIDSALRIFRDMSRSCGVDSISLGILLKANCEARRIDEAFGLLESVEKGDIVGSPKLSPTLIYGLLNALIEAGDLRRANGLLARCHAVLTTGGPSIILYNLLMKGYINTGFPQNALTVHAEILRQGLKPDRLTYNTLIFACVKSGNMDAAMKLFAEMKNEAEKNINCELLPDAVTYTTLLKGFGLAKDMVSVHHLVLEMKSLHDLFIDRIAYTAMIDSLLNCGSTNGALCIFGEILKQAGMNPLLRPKPHLYLSMMRDFAAKGDYSMVKSLHSRILPDTSGVISHAVQVEADELLMEAALNNGQVDVAREILIKVNRKWEGVSWTNRGSMVAVRIEALSGFEGSTFSPYLLPQASLGDPIENMMTPFENVHPLQAKSNLKSVVMRFYRDEVVPIIDDWDGCIGLVHREDCNELNAPLSTIMRAPPPCVTTSTSIGRVVDLLLEKKYKMVVIVKPNTFYETSYSSNIKAVGIFTSEQLFNSVIPASQWQESCMCTAPN
ncbi:hypothetical protein GIB67_022567 [Kingdonia uniflora]|uniref:CBS domain-containing protein n=1 Tax=Kingdonia uniflora TaxID=39325 RepID=A0A7J7L7G8_9MAGN|nr:hypothetical protein GIB67_022567 [Kingdonia uniflora]